MVARDLGYASRAEGGAVNGHLVWDVLDPADEDEETILETIEADGVLSPVRHSKRMEVDVGEFQEADATWTGAAAPFAERGLPEPNTTGELNGVNYFVLATLADTPGAGVMLTLKRVE